MRQDQLIENNFPLLKDHVKCLVFDKQKEFPSIDVQSSVKNANKVQYLQFKKDFSGLGQMTTVSKSAPPVTPIGFSGVFVCKSI